MIEPGTRFAGRYRLEDRASDTGGATLWKATDETLARPVSVLTFAPECGPVEEVVTAARAASRLTDARLVQVFDAEISGADSYVVMEWVAGQRLDELLLSGFDAERAAGIVAEAAEALTSAHAAGLAHLCLQPSSVLWTSGGSVKVSGLGIDAALVGARSDQPALLDTHSLGKLLYAGLTGTWPGGEQTALPTAPLTDGNHVATPRQVRAGVPAQLDAVVCRTLFPGTRRGDAITTPAELADALADVPRSVPLPIPTLYDRPSPSGAAGATSVHDPGPPSVVPPGGSHRPPSGRGRGMRGTTGFVVAGVIVLVLIAAGLIAWGVRKNMGTSPQHSASPSPSHSAAAPRKLDVASATGFDPEGNDGDENDADAPDAVDGDAGTYWHTSHYGSPAFGKLKSGVGLALDLGKVEKVGSVQVTFKNETGGAIELRTSTSKPTPDSLQKVAEHTGLDGDVTLKPSKPVDARYLVLWFTRLPKLGNGANQGNIYSVVVRGTPN